MDVRCYLLAFSLPALARDIAGLRGVILLAPTRH